MKRVKQNRRRWFQFLKGFLRLPFRKRKYIFLGEKPEDKSLIFSNHVYASSPLFHELYAPFKLRFWGTYEMDKSLKSNFQYLSSTYLHIVKKINIILAKIVGFIICPFIKWFYNGVKIIPTHTDYNFLRTLKLTEKSLNEGENIVIFPEDLSQGCPDVLTHYYCGGFYAADKYCSKFKCDLKIFNCYYVKKIRTFIIDTAILFSELKKEFDTNYQAMADKFCARANEIGELFRPKPRKTN